MRVLRAILLMLVLGSFLSCKEQPRDLVIARVGDRVITADEFRSRFALTPYFSQFSRDPQVKALALASFIGEKLLALQAGKAGLANNNKYRAFARQMKKEVVIEALLNDLFSDMPVGDQEIKAAFVQSQRVLDVEELVFADKTAALAARGRITSGQGFQAWVGEKLSENTQSSNYRVEWGTAEPKVEEVLWGLRLGEVSAPVPYENHYYLFRIAGERSNPFPSDAEYNQRRSIIEKTIRKRKKERKYRDFFHKLMAGHQTRVPAEIMTYIAERLETAFEIPPSKTADSTQASPTLMTESQFLLAGETLGHYLRENFITFDDGSFWTVGDFLRNLRYGPYPLNYASKAAFRQSLRTMAIMMMEQEYVAKDGYRRGLDNTKAVKEEVQIWSDSFLADQMRLQVIGPRAQTNGAAGHPRHEVTTASKGASQPLRTLRIKLLDEALAAALDSYAIEINKQALDSLQVDNLKMVVFKTHFPGRPVAPALLPLDRLPVYFGKVFSKIEKD